MTERNLDEDLAVCEQASEPLEKVTSRDVYPAVVVPGTRVVAVDFEREVDADFMVMARTALPFWLSKVKALSSEIEALKEERDRLREAFQRADLHCDLLGYLAGEYGSTFDAEGIAMADQLRGLFALSPQGTEQ